MKVTAIQEQLLGAVQERGGRVKSLRRLTSDLGIDYVYAWICLTRLERAGLVTVERRQGHPLVIVSNPCSDQILQALETLRRYGI